MSTSNFDELRKHVGHKIECVAYAGRQTTSTRNVAVECETCQEVLLDYDKQGGD